MPEMPCAQPIQRDRAGSCGRSLGSSQSHRRLEPIEEQTVTSDSEKYWYNLKTGEVEKGYESPAVDRAGPFDTPEEAAKAPEIIRERSRAWAEEEAREDS
jgi:hypothetical protein